MNTVLYYIDYGNKNPPPANFTGRIVTIPFVTDIATTVRQIPDRTGIIWIASSICDYNNFRFDLTLAEPDSGQLLCDVLYVFPSDTQQRGDTFVLHGQHLQTLIDGQSIAFSGLMKNVPVYTESITRLPEPVFEHDHDTHAAAILETEFQFPYATFRAAGHPNIKPDVTPCMWERRFQETTVTSSGATQITVPASAKLDIKTEVWDYHGTYTSRRMATSQPLDIIFFSNGESVADENWNHLLETTKNIPNRVFRVDGVAGRVASQRASAQAATTNWYFLVNAKLRVDSNFDWSWQPDRMQAPKHYIFRALNPVNGLQYGHMAMVCNNKKLTLNTIGTGLDFTMESPVAVVDILSGVARYNTDAWTTWRTAFRECVKLRHQGDSESMQRLEQWLQPGTGDYASFSSQAAQDAVDYYDTVNGDFDSVKLTYDWAWLQDYYRSIKRDLATVSR